jgi:GT2 family glycosyltransferase
VAIDTDDPAWDGREPFMHSHVRYVRWQREPTLGAKLNRMAKETARGRLILWLANDQVMVTKGWPEKCRAAARKLPNGVGVAYLRDPSHPDHTSYWMLTRKMMEARWFANPAYPYWFIDSHWDEVGIISGIKVEIDAEIAAPDGRGRTHAMVDLPFWVDYFIGMRPERAGDAGAIAKEAYGEGSVEWQRVEAGLPRALAVCSSRTSHLRSREFLEQWSGNAESGPPPGYDRTKAKAAADLKLLNDKMPRRFKVAICVPGEMWRGTTGNSVMAMAAYSAMHGIDVSCLNMQSSSVTHARNGTVELALKAGMDALMWLDADMRIPPDALLRLLRHNKDIVGATYNKRVPPYQTLGRLKGPKPESLGAGLYEALMLPGGIMLVRADVYRRIGFPWYAEAYTFDGETGVERFKSLLCSYFGEMPPAEVLEELDGSKLGAWLQEHYVLGEDQEKLPYLSEDLFFCRKARRAGYSLWCDLALTDECAHIGQLEVTCKLSDEKPVDLAAD